MGICGRASETEGLVKRFRVRMARRDEMSENVVRGLVSAPRDRRCGVVEAMGQSTCRSRIGTYLVLGPKRVNRLGGSFGCSSGNGTTC